METTPKKEEGQGEMSKYDEKLVDDVLTEFAKYKPGVIDIENFRDLFAAISRLKPKPAKFYVLPEYWEASIDARVVFQQFGDWSKSEAEPFWYMLREATATDKPLVHIPAGSEWAKDDIIKLRDAWHSWDYSREDQPIAIIDAIKSKLEPKS